MNSRSSVARNHYKEIATALGSSVIEQQIQTGYYGLNVGTTPLPGQVQQPDLPNYTGTVVVSLVDKTLSPTATDVGRKRVDVTVNWNDKLRDKGSVTLTTLITND